jgi:hypothetical protein
MKQYDLNGFKGELASFGSYFIIAFLAIIGIGIIFLKAYLLSFVIVVVAGLFYYSSFILGNRYRRIFFDEEYFYYGNHKVPLKKIISIQDSGILKYELDGKTIKVLFVSFPRPAENLELFKSFCEKII